MKIILLESIDKVRIRVLFEEYESFWLYRSDIRELELETGMELAESDYFRILQEKVLIYAKKRTLELLERMDRTESELKQKLMEREFSEKVATQAIEYARKFHYVDDLRFAINYIYSKSKEKSKKQILYVLYQKGISKDIVERAYEDVITRFEEESRQEQMVNPEVGAILKIVRRKNKPIDEYSKEELMKLTASLYRKGFSGSSIREAISVDMDME